MAQPSDLARLAVLVDPARRPRMDPVRVAEGLDLIASEARAAALLAEGRPVLEIVALTGWQARPSSCASPRTPWPRAGGRATTFWVDPDEPAADGRFPERTVDAGNETDIRGVVVFVGNTV